MSLRVWWPSNLLRQAMSIEPASMIPPSDWLASQGMASEASDPSREPHDQGQLAAIGVVMGKESGKFHQDAVSVAGFCGLQAAKTEGAC